MNAPQADEAPLPNESAPAKARGGGLRRMARKLALSAVTMILFVGAAELLARFAEPGPMSLYDSKPYQDDPGVTYVHKPGFRGRWDSSWYGINSRGMRGPEVEPTFAPDEFRVVCLGDSCTFGKGVVDADTWPRQLEGLLEEHMAPERRPIVFNLGVNGYSLWQYKRVLERTAQELKPHLVVIGYNVNDYDSVASLADGMVFSGEIPDLGDGGGDEAPDAPGGSGTGGASIDASTGGFLGPPATQPQRASTASLATALLVEQQPEQPQQPGQTGEKGSTLRKTLRAVLPKNLRDELNRSALYRFLRATYYDSTRERDYAKMAQIVEYLSQQRPQVQEEVFDDQASMLADLIATADTVGARVAIFLFPFEGMVVLQDFDRGPERFVERLAEHAGVGFVDVPEAFRARVAEVGGKQRLFVRGDRYHPNAAGYGIVSRTVFDGLLRQGYFDPEE